MRFKTHHSSIGGLMFREFDSQEDLFAEVAAHKEELHFTELVVLVEDSTTQSGWELLAKSTHLVDFVEPREGDLLYPGQEDRLPGGTWESDDADAVSDALDRGAFVRWVLFSDDEPLDRPLWVVINMHGTDCRCPAHNDNPLPLL